MSSAWNLVVCAGCSTCNAGYYLDKEAGKNSNSPGGYCVACSKFGSQCSSCKSLVQTQEVFAVPEYDQQEEFGSASVFEPSAVYQSGDGTTRWLSKPASS